MKDSLRQQFERLAMRLGELDATLADPSIASDMKRYRELSREHAEVSGLVERFRRFEQRERDLLWIREEFLESRANFGRVVVHGHTPTDAPEVRHNRIGLDTGAYRSGRLTALGLQGTQRWLIEVQDNDGTIATSTRDLE